MILTVIDHLTKRAHFIPTSVTATSQDSLALLFNPVQITWISEEDRQ